MSARVRCRVGLLATALALAWASASAAADAPDARRVFPAAWFADAAPADAADMVRRLRDEASRVAASPAG